MKFVTVADDVTVTQSYCMNCDLRLVGVNALIFPFLISHLIKQCILIQHT